MTNSLGRYATLMKKYRFHLLLKKIPSMSTNPLKYKVYIRDYAKKHYIKTFEKKYGKYWDITLEAITASLERMDTFLTTSKAEKILSVHEKNLHIVKCEFRVVNSRDSAHAS